MKGVLRVMVPARTKEADIVLMCHNAIIGNAGLNVFDHTANANRVIFWYGVFFRNQVPVIIINASERTTGAEPAELTGAVRRLCQMGVNVVVDASPNSLTPDLLCTTRQLIMEVEALSEADIRTLPQLKELFCMLDTINLSPVVMHLLGGVPSQYVNLLKNLVHHQKVLPLQGATHSTVFEIVLEYLQSMLDTTVREAVTLRTRQPKFADIYGLLKDQQKVDMIELEKRGLELPSPCKILRLSGTFVVPTSPMVSWYCKHDSNAITAKEALSMAVEKARG